MQLEEIRQKLADPSEDARFAAWMEFYSESSQLHFPFEDPTLKISFIHFLARLPEERAVDFLVRFLEYPNVVVQETAKKGLEKNKFDRKWSLLLPLLNSPAKGARYYAIEKLSQALVLDAMAPMLALLAQADSELLIQLLKALRYYGDERILPHILSYLESEVEEIRLRAVLILGSLYEGEVKGTRKFYLRALKDSSPQIRGAVLWGLKRRVQQQDLKILFAISSADPDPWVREEAVAIFLFFPKLYPVVLHLLKILTEEKDRTVLLKTEGIVASFPEEFLVKHLWKAVQTTEGSIRGKALLFLAERRDPNKRCFRFLARELTKGTWYFFAKQRAMIQSVLRRWIPQPKSQHVPKKYQVPFEDKLPLIEALGLLLAPEACPLLESQLVDNPLLGYAAMGALLKIWSHHPKACPVEKYLTDPKLAPLLKQTILKQMLKTNRVLYWSQDLESVLINLLKEDNLNIRYLSAQVLAPVSSETILAELAKQILRETDPATLTFLQESLRRILSERPEWMSPLVQSYREDGKAVSLFFTVMQEAELMGKPLNRLLRSLMDAPLRLHQSSHRQLFCDFTAGFLRQRKLQLKSFLTAIEDLPDKGELLLSLSRILSTLPEQEIPVALLERWLGTETPRLDGAIVTMAGLSSSHRAVRFLTSIVCDPKVPMLHSLAKSGLQHCLRGVS